jgi:surfeit locus 1 family protein
MARLVGAQPVWIEETVEPDFVVAMENMEKGVPIARAAEVNLRNNHMQYIVTWYGLALATSVMFYILVRKPPTDIAKRVRHSTDWA